MISTTQNSYKCDKCKDVGGFLVKVDEGIEYWQICSCEKQRKIESLFKNSQITDKFKEKGFNNFIRKNRPEIVNKAFNISVQYFKNFENLKTQKENSIAIFGQPGSGKTHLLMAIANNFIRNGIPVLYITWIDLFNELKKDFNELDSKIHKLKTVDILFLDDLFKGRQHVTDFQLEQLFSIINYRYLNHLPMLLSSERDINEIIEIDEGIGSRIYEMCKKYMVILHGDNLNYRLNQSTLE